ncbi:MAG: TIM44-like domain-containing protein [Elusimicrobiota bacterium]|jgi:predicted lipid-binding transport protein (Tim44 family)|nr:TIM44-like domain-containing protein [Elusimicrobiota bacterium]
MHGKFLKLFFASVAALLFFTCAFADSYDGGDYNELNSYLSNRQSSRPADKTAKPAPSRTNDKTLKGFLARGKLLAYLLYAFFAGGTTLVVLILNKMEDAAFGGHTLEAAEPGVITNNTPEIIFALRDGDTSFSPDQFLEKAKEVFKTLKNAYNLRDINKLPLMAQEQYTEHKTKIGLYIENKQINECEIRGFEEAYFYKYDKTAEYEYLLVLLKAELTNYVIDAGSGAIIRGDPKEFLTERWLLNFRRDARVLEPTKNYKPVAVVCPYCGAPALFNNFGHCVYCNTIIKAGNYEWFLFDFDKIWPDSRYAPGGVFVNNKRTDRYEKLNG